MSILKQISVAPRQNYKDKTDKYEFEYTNLTQAEIIITIEINKNNDQLNKDHAKISNKDFTDKLF